MPESFGAGLRQRREGLQVSLTTIAEQTKIKLALLEDLERDDVSRWPSGIFRRAFIRAYAHAIGLDPDIVVREFLELHPDPVEHATAGSTVAPAVQAGSVSDGPPTRLRCLVGAALRSLSPFGRRPASEPGRSAVERIAAAERPPRDVVAPHSLDLCAAARLCTELGQLDETQDAAPLLQQAAGILDAVGLIVWEWDPQATELAPVLAHGYSDKVLAQLPKVRRDDDNATASAFRSAQTTVVSGSKVASGALVVPLMTPAGCGGVLAVELKPDSAPMESIRAVVTIFAAQLARLVEVARAARAVDRQLSPNSEPSARSRQLSRRAILWRRSRIASARANQSA